MEVLEGVVFDAEETEGEINNLMNYWMVHGKGRKQCFDISFHWK